LEAFRAIHFLLQEIAKLICGLTAVLAGFVCLEATGLTK
jgi:hypothetical protein